MSTPELQIDGHQVAVVPGQVKHLAWIDSLRKRHRDLGFIPRNAMGEYLETGRVVVACLAGEAVAYIVANPKRNGTIHLAQLAVEDELWRNGVGGRMLELLSHAGEARGCQGITAKPALGLVVEHALRSQGFNSIGTMTTPGRTLRGWWLPLTACAGRTPVLPPMSNKSRYNGTWSLTVEAVRSQGKYSRPEVRGGIVLPP